MIVPTQKRLTIRFAVIVVFFNIVIFATSFFYLNHSLLKSLEDFVNRDIDIEFLPFVRGHSTFPLDLLREEEYFQIFDNRGSLVSGSHRHQEFTCPMNQSFFDKALQGVRSADDVTCNDMRFLVIYFQINEQHIGRAGLPLTALINYERNFLKLVLITLPLTLLASFAVSRYLVHLAMKPIGDVFTFQENFSSNVTHELRSPLASLKGNLEVALRKQRTPEEYRAALDLGLHEVDRITNLLNNLHLLASSKFKPLDLLRERTNMRAIFEELIKQFEPVFNAKGITVDAAGLHDLSCSCDSVLMRRAIENLFDNAIKYTPEGGSIRVSIVESERQLLLRIENSCALQVKEEVNNYFQPFFRGDQGRAVNTGGKGLGLYIARYVLRSHGGDIAMRVTESGTCLVEIAVPRA